MEPKHRKILFICIGVVVASYVVRSVVITALQMTYYQQQAIRAAQIKQAKAKAAPPPASKSTPADAPAPPPAPTIPASLMNLSGVWAGQAALRGKGLCDLTFVLREKKEEPGHFSGSPSMTCVGYGPLVAKNPPSAASIIEDRRNPEAVLLTGGVAKDFLKFHVDKIIAPNSHVAGCAPTSLSASHSLRRPLSRRRVGEEGACPGGRMFLHKVGR